MKHTIKTKRIKKDSSCQSHKKSQTKGNCEQGFTLIELIISVFIFLLIMTATVTIFTREITAYRIARETQKNLENAQFTLNFIAKTLRTSQVNKIVDSALGDVVYAYDHSQGRCFIFSFVPTEGQLKMARETTQNGSNASECTDNASLPSMDLPISLTVGKVTGNFEGKKTQGADINCQDDSCITLGAITTSLVIEPEGGAHGANNVEKVFIQSTSSLRDYPNAGIPL